MISLSDPVLEFSRRKKIYQLVFQYAGCHFRDLERKSKMPASSLKYHLDYLSRHKVISEIKEGNTVRYFPLHVSFNNREILGLLRQQSIRRILLLLTIHDSCIPDEFARFLQVSPSTISWHLKKLERRKVIIGKRNGRSIHYTLTDKQIVVNLLLSYKESFLDTLVDNAIRSWDI